MVSVFGSCPKQDATAGTVVSEQYYFCLAANVRPHTGKISEGAFGKQLTYGYVVDFPMAAGDHL